MKEIEWTDSFSVGSDLFDRQHIQIIDLINKLIANSNSSVDSVIVSDILTKMTEYALIHFRDEEQFLYQNNYEDIEDHKKLHRDFITKTVSFCQATTLQIDVVPDKLLTYLKEWWIHHILVEDMQYKYLLIEDKKEAI